MAVPGCGRGEVVRAGLGAGLAAVRPEPMAAATERDWARTQ